MPDIAVARAFVLTLNSGERHQFSPGIYKGVSEEIAGHWYTKLNLVPDQTEVDTAETAMVDAAGIAALEQRAALAEDNATRLRAELARVTVAWTDAELRAQRAEAALAEAEIAAPVGEATREEQTAAIMKVAAERDSVTRELNELKAEHEHATARVQQLTQEMTAAAPAQAPSAVDAAPVPTPAEPVEFEESLGDYTIRKRGRKYLVMKLDGNGAVVETVSEEDSRQNAEDKVTALKAGA